MLVDIEDLFIKKKEKVISIHGREKRGIGKTVFAKVLCHNLAS
jgi:hypothetical protein